VNIGMLSGHLLFASFYIEILNYGMNVDKYPDNFSKFQKIVQHIQQLKLTVKIQQLKQ